jgi:hypothetical protein
MSHCCVIPDGIGGILTAGSFNDELADVEEMLEITSFLCTGASARCYVKCPEPRTCR